MNKNVPKTRETAEKLLFAAANILKENGGEMAGRDVVSEIEKTIPLTDFEKEKFEKSGYVRWQSILHFHSIALIKAGFLRKIKGVWYLTPDGEKALKSGPQKFYEQASEAYRLWSNEREVINIGDSENQQNAKAQSVNLDDLESQALEGLMNFVRSKNAYEFQDLVAALLKAMGYHISYISPKGPDGGVDIVAYQDPLGTKAPRIKVQVKHKPDASIPVSDIRGLSGLLRSGDVGLFVTSGKFTNEGAYYARDTSDKHIELIDSDKFIRLWEEYYLKLNDEDKNLLPLYPIYFLGSND